MSRLLKLIETIKQIEKILSLKKKSPQTLVKNSKSQWHFSWDYFHSPPSALTYHNGKSSGFTSVVLVSKTRAFLQEGT